MPAAAPPPRPSDSDLIEDQEPEVKLRPAAPPPPPLEAPPPLSEAHDPEIPMTESDLAGLDLEDDACVTRANYAKMAARVSQQAADNLKKTKMVRTALESTPPGGTPITRKHRTRRRK